MINIKLNDFTVNPMRIKKFDLKSKYLLIIISFSLIFLPHTDQSFAQSNQVSVDKRIIEISQNMELVKIYGYGDTSKNIRQKAVIIITTPLGSQQSHTIFTNNEAYFELIVPFDMNSPNGEYQVFASVDSVILNKISFEIKKNIVEKIQRGEISFDINGKKYQIPFSLTSVKLLDYDFYPNNKEIELKITSLDNNGFITLTIPRNLLDSKNNNNDSNFLFYINDKQETYTERVTNSEIRSITFRVNSESDTIRIVGNQILGQVTQNSGTTVQESLKTEPTPQPKVEPTPQPKVEPTPQPKVEPTPQPKVEPTPQPKVEPNITNESSEFDANTIVGLGAIIVIILIIIGIIGAIRKAVKNKKPKIKKKEKFSKLNNNELLSQLKYLENENDRVIIEIKNTKNEINTIYSNGINISNISKDIQQKINKINSEILQKDQLSNDEILKKYNEIIDDNLKNIDKNSQLEIIKSSEKFLEESKTKFKQITKEISQTESDLKKRNYTMFTEKNSAYNQIEKQIEKFREKLDTTRLELLITNKEKLEKDIVFNENNIELSMRKISIYDLKEKINEIIYGKTQERRYTKDGEEIVEIKKSRNYGIYKKEETAIFVESKNIKKEIEKSKKELEKVKDVIETKIEEVWKDWEKQDFFDFSLLKQKLDATSHDFELKFLEKNKIKWEKTISNFISHSNVSINGLIAYVNEVHLKSNELKSIITVLSKKGEVLFEKKLDMSPYQLIVNDEFIVGLFAFPKNALMCYSIKEGVLHWKQKLSKIKSLKLELVDQKIILKDMDNNEIFMKGDFNGNFEK